MGKIVLVRTPVANRFQLPITSDASITRPLTGALFSHFSPWRKRGVG
jgi:hypothetical protein